MSGPNDSGGGDTPTGDFKLPTFDRAAPQALSPRFRLQLHWDTPRLEWRPTQANSPAPRDQPAFLKLDDPFGAVATTEQYILSGGLLFDMRRPRFEVIDKAFLDAPTTPPPLIPSFAEMKAWEDDAFYRRLGRSAPLRGAPAPPTPDADAAGDRAAAAVAVLQSSRSRRDARPIPAAPKAGSFGDILKALHGLPIVQRVLNLLSDEGLRQVRVMKNEWDTVALARPHHRDHAERRRSRRASSGLGARRGRRAPLCVQGTEGRRLPVPFVPGLSLHVSDFGRPTRSCSAPRPSDPHQPQAIEFGLKFDVLKAIPAVRKVFHDLGIVISSAAKQSTIRLLPPYPAELRSHGAGLLRFARIDGYLPSPRLEQQRQS